MGKLLLGIFAGTVAGALLEDPIRKAWNASGAQLLARFGIDAKVHTHPHNKEGGSPNGES